MIGDLVREIETIQDRVRQLVHDDSQISEQDTKLAIINPILSALGWDLSDLTQVRSEYRYRSSDDPVDYAMFRGGVPVMFVEAKRLGANLANRRFVTQVVSYAATVGVNTCVLTDGDEYRFYHAHAQVDAEEKLFMIIRLGKDSPAMLEEKLALISPEGVLKNNVADIWQRQYVDKHVRSALEQMVETQDRGLVRLLRKHAEDLSANDISKSLGRLRLSFEFTSLGLSPQDGELPVEPRTASASRASRQHGAPEAAVAGPMIAPASRPSASLADLITAGAVVPPLELFARYKGEMLKAVVRSDGMVEFDGGAYSSPSAAAGYARNKVNGPPPDGRPYWNTNGWVFWSFMDAVTDKEQTLDLLRQRFREWQKS